MNLEKTELEMSFQLVFYAWKQLTTMMDDEAMKASSWFF
jgi:hypothetical protein